MAGFCCSVQQQGGFPSHEEGISLPSKSIAVCSIPDSGTLPRGPHPSSVAPRALRRQIPEVGAECPNGARSALCGGRSVALSNERPYRDLRNVVANYPFESSREFPGSEPNSGHGDHSRLSCSAGDTQLGTGLCRDLQQAFCTGVGHECGVAEKPRIGRDLFRSEDDPPAAKPSTPLPGEWSRDRGFAWRDSRPRIRACGFAPSLCSVFVQCVSLHQQAFAPSVPENWPMIVDRARSNRCVVHTT